MTLVEQLPTFIGSATEEDFRAAYLAVPCVWFRQVRNHHTSTITTDEMEDTVTCSRIVTQHTDDDDDDGDANHIGRKRKRPTDDTQATTSSSTGSSSHPDSTLDCSFSSSSSDRRGRNFVKIILDTFQSATAKDQESWCIENTNDSSSSSSS